MNISIFGLGYVGCVNLACLAKSGHTIVGVDINKNKVASINQGNSPVSEPMLADIIKTQHSKSRVRATTNFLEAIESTDLSIICVGTPLLSSKKTLDLKNIFAITEQIGKGLIIKRKFHTVIIRSTVMPGTVEKIISLLEASTGLRNKKDFAVVLVPEFMREGTSIYDYYNPPYVILGSDSEKGLKAAKNIYKNINAPVLEIGIKETEILKLVNNAFHALKICFSNEVGNICKKFNINAYKVMDIFCKDNKLNISTKYLRPGLAYGGSCLPKDLNALVAAANRQGLRVPLLKAAITSNDFHKKAALELIRSFKKKNIGIVGLAFKNNTDDLRGSPAMYVARKLLANGYKLKIYDKNLHFVKIIGKNKKFMKESLPHIKNLKVDTLKDLVNFSEVVVIFHKSPGIIKYIHNYPEKKFIDLVGHDNNGVLKNYINIF